MTENGYHDIKTPTFFVLNTHLLTYRKEFPQKVWLPNQLWEQKNTDHSHPYYNAMKPIFIILTMCGIFPAFKARSGISKCTRYAIAVYTVLAYTVLALLSGYTFFLIIETSPSGRHTDLTHTLAISTQSLFLMQEFVYVFATWKESDYVFEYVEEWIKLQEHFKSVTGESIDLVNIGRNVKITSPLAVLWVVLGILTFYFYYDNLTLCMSLVFGYQVLNTVMMLKLWVFNYFAISSAINQYEKHFNKNCVNSQSDHQLQEFRLLWLHITNIIRQSGDMLSSTLLFFHITAYIINIVSAYSFIYDVMYTIQNNENYIENVVMCAIAFFATNVLTFIFHNAPYYTEQKCVAAVKPYLTNVKPTRMELLNEVHLFIRTIQLVPPECNMRGFIRIDRNSFLMCFGTRITYLIILLQFDISINDVQISSIIPTLPANITVTVV